MEVSPIQQNTDALSEIVSAFGFIVLVVVGFISLALMALVIAGKWRTLEKMGKHGWEAIVPFYGTYTIARASGCDGWLAIAAPLAGVVSWLMLLPGQKVTFVLSVVFSIAYAVLLFMVYRKLAAHFGKGTLFAVGLLFFPFIAFVLLGYGAATASGGRMPKASESDENRARRREQAVARFRESLDDAQRREFDSLDVRGKARFYHEVREQRRSTR